MKAPGKSVYYFNSATMDQTLPMKKTLRSSSWILYYGKDNRNLILSSVPGHWVTARLQEPHYWAALGPAGSFHILITVHVFKERRWGIFSKVVKHDSTYTWAEAKAWSCWPPETHLNQVLSFLRKQFILKFSSRQSFLLISVSLLLYSLLHFWIFIELP